MFLFEYDIDNWCVIINIFFRFILVPLYVIMTVLLQFLLSIFIFKLEDAHDLV